MKKIVVAFGVVCMAVGPVCTQASASCDPAPSGLVGWWQAEGNVNDGIGANTGILVNGATFATGKVGQAFSFSGATQYVGIPQSPSLNTFSNQMTIEFWMYANPGNSMATFQGLVTSDYYGIEISSGVGFGANGINWYVNTRNGAYLISNVNGGGIPVSPGQWHHIAGTYDGNKLQLYIDGQPRGNPEPASGAILPMLVNSFVAIGSDDGRTYCGCTGRYFWGLIDEASIYNRALSAGEIAAIYNADSAGKCPLALVPPVIVSQPTNQTVTAGGTATFGVVVSGTGPFTYQWLFNGNIITPNGIITTVAGNGSAGYSGDGGAATNAALYYPYGLALDASGNLFFADFRNNRARKVDTKGIITTMAGNGSAGYSGDNGSATNASLNTPTGVALDAYGNILIADYHNNRIRKVSANGIITAIVGNGFGTYSGDGGAATNASLNTPGCTAMDAAGNLFIADNSNNRIRKVDTNGIITTVAGNGTTGYSGDGGAATNASFNDPTFLAVDGSGNLFVADYYNNRVRKVDTKGIITTVAGNGTTGYSGDGGPATNAGVYLPICLAVDANGNLFIGDGNNRLRKVNTGGIITTVAGNGNVSYSGDGGAATNAGVTALGVAVDASGNLFISDLFNNRIRKVGSGGSPILTLNNVTTSNAGNYQVIVTGPCGSITSSAAMLTVNSSSTCVPVPSGIVAWWRGEGNANDSIGANNGTLVGGAGFAPGEAGQAFSFDGTSSYVSIPDSPSVDVLSDRITVEAWIKVNHLTANPDWEGIVTKGNASWRLLATAGAKTVYFASSGTTPNNDIYGTRNVNDGNWHYVAAVYDGTNLSLYVDGTLDVSKAASGSIWRNSDPVCIGYIANTGLPGNYHFDGLIDEVSIYSRALSSNEIAAIYSAGSAGKCFTATPPVIITQPTNQMASVGGTATFRVSATGTQPLFYQWRFNGTNILGATNALLTLSNVQPVQAGIYVVQVANGGGSTNSANAVLTVITPPSSVPVITGFSPASGMTGISVRISGTNFSPVAASNTVYFGAVKAVVSAASATNLVVSVPAGATYAPITVTVKGLTAYANAPFLPTFASSGMLSSSSLGPQMILPAGRGPGQVVITDFDGDGKPDLAGNSGLDHTICIYRNISTNGFLATNSFAPPVVLQLGTGSEWGMVAADVDGDGKPDLVFLDYNSNVVSVLQNLCTPGIITTNSFGPRVNFAVGSNPEGVAMQDLDGDGKPEIVTANTGGGTISVLRNIGTAGIIATGSFAPAVNFAGPTSIRDVAIADLDGDGRPDVVTVNYANGSNNVVSAFRNVSTPGNIAFASRVDFPGPVYGYKLAIGDVDGDGKLDVVFVSFANGQSVSVYRNTGTPGSISANSFASRVDFDVGGWGNGVALGDLDGDGKPDVAVPTKLPSDLSLFRNVSTPGGFASSSFAGRLDFASGSGPYGVAIGDLDGDGRPDVVYANNGDNTLSVCHNITPSGGTPSCDPAPSGMVGWWQAEGNANDSAGINNGVLQGGVGFASGKVGQAFLFNNTNADVRIPASSNLDVGAGDGFTLEAWINPSDLSQLLPLFEWNAGDGTTYWGVHFYSTAQLAGELYANIVDSGGGWHIINSAGGVVTSGVFQHVALTYHKASGIATIYHNGTVIVQQNVGSFTPQTTYSLNLGRRPGPEANYTYAGLMDEPSIYNRALSSNEIAAIYNAGSGGKCPLPTNYVYGTVVSPQPTLATVKSGANLQLTWPVSAGTFHVQSAETPLGPWADAAYTVTTNGESAIVTVTATNQQQYFRLVGQ